MRSKQEKLERLVCAEHCRFFKPWETEAVRCGAHTWLLQRIVAIEATLDLLEKLRGEKRALHEGIDAVLLRAICTRCDHFPYACNYRNPQRAENAVPCGGLAVLGLLLDRGALTLEELYDPPWRREPQSPRTDAE